MSRVEVDSETRLAPDQVVAALTDFSDRRTDVWADIAPQYYEVYSVGDHEADAREGTVAGPMKIWAKEHYEWSPDRVRWTVVESNFCSPGSFVEAQISAGPDGGSRIHTVWERTPTTLMARVLFTMIRMSKGKPIKDSLEKGLARFERISSDN